MNKRWIALTLGLALAAGVAEPVAATAAATPSPATATTATTATATAKATDSSPPLVEPSAPPRERARHVRPQTKPKHKLTNVNAATRQQLKALPGGSDDEADRIIAGRPYNSKAFLLSKNVVGAARFDEIRNLVVAGRPAKSSVPKK